MTPPDTGQGGQAAHLSSVPGKHALRAVRTEQGDAISRASSLPAGNLPLELTSFVGREKELADAKKLLADHRMLTLNGPGGCGKTRLALALAFEAAESFTDGTQWVGLASLFDPALLPQEIARELGVLEAPDRPLTDRIIEYLEPKHALLVLDNCEHLVDACAVLVETLLRHCPALKILATSRETLGVAGEITWPVPPLSWPEPRQLLPTDSLMQYEAVRLFVERAKAATPSFELTDQNAFAIAQVCQRLAGMPLAIELAAARVRTLSVGQISERLEDPLSLLAAGARTATPRQRSLRATLEWSHDLLSEPEKELFRRMSVFAGGWALEAAEIVGTGGAIERDDILNLLSQLVDKSMVVAERGAEGASRYSMLLPVRHYGNERLEDSGEAERFRRRHADHYLALAEEAEPELGGARQKAWLERLEREHGNFRTALGWTFEGQETELGLRLGGALGGFWYVRGHLSEGRRWLDAALAQAAEAPDSARAKALARAGWLAWTQGDYERSATLSEESLALYRKVGNDAGVALALHNLGYTEMHRNALAKASALIEEAVMLQRSRSDAAGLARSLPILGLVAVASHDYERAAALHEENLARAREAVDDFAVVVSLIPGALAYAGLGEHRRARSLCGEGLELAWRLRMMHQIAAHLHVSAVLVSLQGQSGGTARLWGAAEALRETVGISLSPVERTYFGPYIDSARSQLGEARWGAAWAEGRAMTPEEAVEYALDELKKPDEEDARSAQTETAPAVAKVTPRFRIFALSTARVEVAGHTLTSSEWTYAKSRELLFYLLSHPPRTREQVGLDLWPDASPSRLRRAFHNALYYLRQALGQQEWVVFERGRYTFNHSLGHWFDVEAFEWNRAEAWRLKTEAPGEAVRHLEEAVALYKGDFLEGSPGGEWVLARQDELRRAYEEALLELGELLFEGERYTEAAEAYRKVIAFDRYSEVAHRRLMRSYAGRGEPGRALRHYQDLSEMLGEELGSSPAPETAELYERLRNGENP
jgi:predicted ATPase/DNA-binding SARP family transcriptional activator